MKLFPEGKGEKEDRFGKVAACKKSKCDADRSMNTKSQQKENVMKRQLSKTIGYLAMGLALIAQPAFAKDISEENLRTRVGLNAVSEERFLEIEQQRQEEPEYENEDEDVVAKPCSFQYYDYSLLYLEALGYKGSSLYLSDGSIWITRPSDGKKIQHWPDYNSEYLYGEHPAEVYLTTNNNWFFGTDYKYRVVNRTTKESALVNMSQGPLNQYAFFIWNIDNHNGFIEIVGTNGIYMLFKMSGWDEGVYSKWQINDAIILGRNSRWNKSSNPYLLINVNTLTNARAKAG